MWRRLTHITETKIRLGIAGVFGLVVLATIAVELDHGVKAPILVLSSGGLLLTGLFPEGKPRPREWVAIFGTLVGAGSGWYWLLAATNGKAAEPLALVLLGAAAIAIVLFLGAVPVLGLGVASSARERYQI